MNDLLLTPVLSVLMGVCAYVLFPHFRRWTQRVLSDSFFKFDRARIAQSVDWAFYAIFFITLFFMWLRAFHRYASFGSWPDVIWNNDRVLVGLLRGDDLLPFLADRYNPIIVAFVPLYALWSDARVLLFVQTTGLAITALPVYWYTRARQGHWLGFFFGLACFLSAPIQSQGDATIFELKFATPLIAGALFFLLRQRYVPFFVVFGLALLTKENIAVLAVGFALFIFFVQRQRALGLVLGVAGIAGIVLISEWLYPAFHEGRPFYLWAERYAYLGNTLGQIVWSLGTRPEVALQRILAPEHIAYIANPLLSFGGLAAFGIEVTALALPSLLFALLSEWPQQADLYSYYQAPIIPILFFGASVGLARALDWRGFERGDRMVFALCVFVATSAGLIMPGTWTSIINPGYLTIAPRDVIGHQLVAQIPAGTMVVSQTEFVTWLHYTRQYRVRHLTPHGDYRNADYMFGDVARPWYAYRQSVWEHWRASGYFELLVERDGYFLLKRKSSFDPTRQFDNGWALLGYSDAPSAFNQRLAAQFENELTLLNYAVIPSDRIQRGEKLRVIAEWQADRDLSAQYIVLARVQDARGHVWGQMDRQPIVPTTHWKSGDILRDQYDFDLPRFMPPGNYRLTFEIWDGGAERSLMVVDSRGDTLGIEVTVHQVQVEKDAAEFPADYLQVEFPHRVRMGDLNLLGTTTIPSKASPGEEISIGLYWQARVKPQRGYWVGFQLLDQSGQVVLEQGSAPAGGTYPTLLWTDKEIILDWHDLVLPHFLSPEPHSLIVLARRDDGAEVGRAAIATISIAR